MYVTQTITICSNDSLQIGSNYYDSSGIYNDTLITGSSCDTIFIIELKTNMIYDTIIPIITCDNYITNNGDTRGYLRIH